jgi:hypothetical protein
VSAPLRIALFAALLALTFGGATLARADRDADDGHAPADAGAGAEHGQAGHHAAAAPTGPALAAGSYAWRSTGLRRPRGAGSASPAASSTRTTGALRDFDLEHDRRMHLIVVRRDLTGFQHPHPEMAPDGTWSTPLELGEPGGYRVFADFKSGGAARTLGADLHVAGRFAPRDCPTRQTPPPPATATWCGWRRMATSCASRSTQAVAASTKSSPTWAPAATRPPRP